jgi:hypothetical protein
MWARQEAFLVWAAREINADRFPVEAGAVQIERHLVGVS